jgi:enamine deaminase RidA (YjgF/YER057c/UK114 family)
MSRDALFRQAAEAEGFAPDGEIRVGGNYVPLLRDGAHLYLSGQVPRIGSDVVVTGRAGAGVTLEQAQRAARICTLRALALLQRELGSLDGVRQILRLTVYVQCAPDFTQHSEVADAASGLLQQVLGTAGVHTRTSVGVYQLPKNATVELDLMAAARD